MKPKIGITTPLSSDEYTIRKEYSNAVSLAGGLPFILPYVDIESEDFGLMLKSVDGILFTGGGDINPELYGEEAHPEVSGISNERDIFEIALCKAAISSNKPILCICRGMQVLNICMGGTLAQHIENHQLKQAQNIHHGIKITPSSPGGEKSEYSLYTILGESELANSRHHQAVILTSQTVSACAYAPDGTIEAIEVPNLRFAIGVQWHPEDMLIDYPSHLKLFEAFIKASSDKGSTNL